MQLAAETIAVALRRESDMRRIRDNLLCGRNNVGICRLQSGTDPRRHNHASVAEVIEKRVGFGGDQVRPPVEIGVEAPAAETSDREVDRRVTLTDVASGKAEEAQTG